MQETFDAHDAKEAEVTPVVMPELERVVLLNVTHIKRREHLYEMDYLQEGIHVGADRLTDYQCAAYDMFQKLVHSI